MDRLLVPEKPGVISNFFEVFYEWADGMDSSCLTDEEGVGVPDHTENGFRLFVHRSKLEKFVIFSAPMAFSMTSLMAFDKLLRSKGF